jgi:nitrate reductase gamma subunit
MNTAAVEPEARQAIVDEEQLRLLSIAHYIDGGLCIAFFSMFIFHFVFFLFIGSNPQFFPAPGANHPGPPEGMFQVLSAILGVIILLGWAFGGLTIFVGRCIKRRVKRGLTLVVACVNLVFLPRGTLLGVATIIVLSRSSVKRAYGV